MTHPALKTRATELFGVQYPIVQTGMGWVSDAKLTAATANAGGLGIISAGLLNYEELAQAISEVQGLTDKPFGVNLRADSPDIGKFIDLLIRAKVKVASFALAPKQDLIGKLKDGGVVVIPSIGARRHAEKVAAWGADAVLVQGGEGGGHTGDVPTSLLLPQVVDAVDIPVIAAGGYFDGRGLVSALAYGAEGIAMGTRFLLTTDSPVAPAVKDVYLASRSTTRCAPCRSTGCRSACSTPAPSASSRPAPARADWPGPGATLWRSRRSPGRPGRTSSARACPCARPTS